MEFIKSVLKNRNLLSIFISFIVFILVFALSSSNSLYFLNKKIQNSYYSIFNKIKSEYKNEKILSNDIIVVEIDDKTLQEWTLWRFPFDRKSYIPLIENLKEAWSSIIAFDIIFAEKTNEDSDKLFYWAINKAWNVMIWWYIETLWSEEDNTNKIFRKSFFSSKYTGFFNPVLDKLNHVVYSVTPYKDIKNGTYDYFGISILKRYYSLIYDKDFNLLDQKIDKNYYYLTPFKKIPLAREWKKEILINYIKNKEYESISFIDIYDDEKFETTKRYTDFKDKIVLIWASAKWIKDIFYTPNGIEPWVYTHVNLINTVLTQNYLQYFNISLELLLIYLLILLSVYFNLSRSGYILITSNIAIIVIFLLIFPIFIIYFTYLILNFPVELVVALVLSLWISNIVKYLIENKNKTKLNKALSEYVSEDVAKEILSWDWKVNLNWEWKDISIFFSDIEWFTTISEKFSPEELVGFLREYLSDMSDIILDEKWFINKYEWDAVMALWWVFWTDSMETYQICVAALNQQKRLKELNIEWKKRWFSEIKARIWMHYWSAIIWNIWSEWRKMEFTALWDSVNLASRLEWVNKFYWTYICASETIYEKQKNHFEFRYIDKIKVKWKDKPIKIYELLWLKWEISDETRKIRELFDKWVKLYVSRDFKLAKAQFEELIVLWDNASRLYLDMCGLYIKNPPLEDWDWVSTMTWK